MNTGEIVNVKSNSGNVNQDHRRNPGPTVQKRYGLNQRLLSIGKDIENLKSSCTVVRVWNDCEMFKKPNKGEVVVWLCN